MWRIIYLNKLILRFLLFKKVGLRSSSWNRSLGILLSLWLTKVIVINLIIPNF
jgi:hypothetical protein